MRFKPACSLLAEHLDTIFTSTPVLHSSSCFLPFQQGTIMKDFSKQVNFFSVSIRVWSVSVAFRKVFVLLIVGTLSDFFSYIRLEVDHNRLFETSFVLET
jgi:hypothetical protein